MTKGNKKQQKVLQILPQKKDSMPYMALYRTM